MADYIVCVTNFSPTADHLYFVKQDGEKIIWSEDMRKANRMPLYIALEVIEDCAVSLNCFDEFILKRI